MSAYEIHENVIFHSWKNQFSDISRKSILPNLISSGTALILFGKMRFLILYGALPASTRKWAWIEAYRNYKSNGFHVLPKNQLNLGGGKVHKVNQSLNYFSMLQMLEKSMISWVNGNAKICIAIHSGAKEFTVCKPDFQECASRMKRSKDLSTGHLQSPAEIWDPFDDFPLNPFENKSWNTGWPRVGKNPWFFYENFKKIGFIWFKSDFHDLNQIFKIFHFSIGYFSNAFFQWSHQSTKHCH